jgi:hypothetical protein
MSFGDASWPGSLVLNDVYRQEEITLKRTTCKNSTMNEVLNLKLVSLFSSQNRMQYNRLSKSAFVYVLRIGTFLVQICKTKEKCDEEEIQLTTFYSTQNSQSVITNNSFQEAPTEYH